MYTLYQQGRRLLETGDPAAAIDPLERAVAQAPAEASLREALGRALLATARLRRAREEFAETIALEPTNDYAHYGLACAYERQGRLARAATHYRLACALVPRAAYQRAAARLARRTGGHP